MEPPETLPADGCTLRRWDVDLVDDLDAAIRLSMPELKRFMPWATDEHGLEDTRGYVFRSIEEWGSGVAWNYAILTAAGEVIGSCGLMTRMGPGVLEIGYWVRSDHTGRGHASAATQALAGAGLALPGIDRVAIKHDVANAASGRVAAKAGFTRVGQILAEAVAPGETGAQLVWERRLAAAR